MQIHVYTALETLKSLSTESTDLHGCEPEYQEGWHAGYRVAIRHLAKLLAEEKPVESPEATDELDAETLETAMTDAEKAAAVLEEFNRDADKTMGITRPRAGS